MRNISDDEKKWKKIFKHFNSICINMSTIEKLVEFGFVLTGTSAEAERVYSTSNNIWRDERNNLSLESLNSTISVQYNSNLTCSEFFNIIKDNKELLKQVKSSEKYMR
jgi:hypothetical protein